LSTEAGRSCGGATDLRMNLEDVEAECIAYLDAASSPLTPVSVLFEHLRGKEEFLGITEAALSDFLSRHSQFRLVDIPFPAEIPSNGNLEAHRTFAMLATRVPSPVEMALVLRKQIDELISAIENGLRETACDRPEIMNGLLAALSRAKAIQARIEGLAQSSSSDSKSGGDVSSHE